MEYSATSQTHVYMGDMKRGGPRQGGGKSTIDQLGDSFLRVIDKEAGARMSGQTLDGPH